jgi:hypothetical protein
MGLTRQVATEPTFLRLTKAQGCRWPISAVPWGFSGRLAFSTRRPPGLAAVRCGAAEHINNSFLSALVGETRFT